MKESKKKRGAKPLNAVALTAAQRKQRERAKLACRIEAAKDNGYTPTTVLLSNKQLTSLSKFSFLETKVKGLIDNRKINDVIFHALKMYLKDLEQDYIERGHPVDVVEMCAYTDDNSADLNSLMQVEADTARLFNEWEKQQ
jgi:hypothetical protein